MFDDLLPPLHELDAFVATEVLGWQGVRWHDSHAGYVGTCPGGTTETPVPTFTQREDLVDAVQAALRGLGYRIEATPVPEGWRVQVDDAPATSRRLPFALCAAAWQALDRQG